MAEITAEQWTIGWTVGAAVVLAVVVLVGTIIYLASGIRSELEQIRAALEEARGNTRPLWDVAISNRLVKDIVGGAREVGSLLRDRG